MELKLYKLFHKHELLESWAVFRRLVKSSINVDTAYGAPGLSRLGGRPVAPLGFSWPYNERTPLSFLCQIDLAEAGHADQDKLLPPHGVLYFFYDNDGTPWSGRTGSDGGARVIHMGVDPSTATSVAPPEGVTSFNASTLNLSREGTLPSLEYPKLGHRLDSAGKDSYWKVRLSLIEQRQYAGRMLGYPDEIQAPMQRRCHKAAGGPVRASTEEIFDQWLLLMQVDSSYEAGMIWGDMGRLYFWITREDLAARRFDRCLFILQSA